MPKGKRDVGFRSANGREDYLIARALFVAARQIDSERYGAHSDAHGMRELLGKCFGQYLDLFENTEIFQRAVSLGYVPAEGASYDEAAKYVTAKEQQAAAYDYKDLPF
ncbi:hypothetical protein [Methylobacterium nigriterrae]|uniref:hypothetical protein n=1 Tax=Methylobacterium nigriterrae TaxID=3127512 RepID=UPI00301407E3